MAQKLKLVVKVDLSILYLALTNNRRAWEDKTGTYRNWNTLLLKLLQKTHWYLKVWNKEYQISNAYEDWKNICCWLTLLEEHETHLESLGIQNCSRKVLFGEFLPYLNSHKAKSIFNHWNPLDSGFPNCWGHLFRKGGGRCL